jgi:hypothetical protein
MWVLPIHHPADILRGRWGLHPANIEYLTRARELAQGTWVPPSITPPARVTALYDYSAIWSSLRWMEHSPDPTTVWDIECAGPHLVCVGIMHLATELYVNFRFREQGGALTWQGTQLRKMAELLDEAFCNPKLPKVFHNGQAFDIPYLERLGFGPVGGYAGDTMLMQRYLYPEMPARLEFVAGLYAGIPAWKWMSKLEGAEEDK